MLLLAYFDKWSKYNFSNSLIMLAWFGVDILFSLLTILGHLQVLAELKEYATEVDVDFVRKAVRAIGRCAIKVEVRRVLIIDTESDQDLFHPSDIDIVPVSLQQSAERCVSTLLDLIQTKVNYVVQEAIVVIRDIFRKYPNKYVSHRRLAKQQLAKLSRYKLVS